MNKILMFSGGIDSTYLAWKLMSSGIFLNLHHVSIRNDSEKMWKPQYNAIFGIIKYFIENGMNFKYTQSEFHFFGWSQIGFDSDILLLAAQKVAQNFVGEVEVILGWNPADMLRPRIADRAKRNVTANIWSALVQSAPNRDMIADLKYPLIEWDKTKEEMIQEMPKDLLDMTWSCRRPVDGNPCGRCHACKAKNNHLF